MSDFWIYTCKVCGAVSALTIGDFMRLHAHGMRPDLLPECEIVRHRDGRSVTFKLPKRVKAYVEDGEDGDKTYRRIRIWITGRKPISQATA